MLDNEEKSGLLLKGSPAGEEDVEEKVSIADYLWSPKKKKSSGSSWQARFTPVYAPEPPRGSSIVMLLGLIVEVQDTNSVGIALS